jgi:hypothetical protein
MTKKDQNKWEAFKKSILIDKKQKVFNSAAELGNCQVKLSCMDDELFLEVLPNETTNVNGDVEGIIVAFDENKCHVSGILKMVSNAKQVKKAKENNQPIKQFEL